MVKVKLLRPVKRVTIYLPNNSISLFISFRFQLQSKQPEELLIICWSFTGFQSNRLITNNYDRNRRSANWREVTKGIYYSHSGTYDDGTLVVRGIWWRCSVIGGRFKLSFEMDQIICNSAQQHKRVTIVSRKPNKWLGDCLPGSHSNSSTTVLANCCGKVSFEDVLFK